MMNITVLFPTATEASLFRHDSVRAVISGVGLSATAYATFKVIRDHRPDWLILAGVAGVYPHAPLQVGDVVLVESEVEGDLGFFTPTGFTHLAHLPIDMEFERRHTLVCPYLDGVGGFSRGRSLSLNAAMSPYVETATVDIENMEGAAFFHVCREEQQRFLELRAISNVVRPGDDEWDLPGAVQAMTTQLYVLIDHLLRG